jgi:hypothetical protein
MRVALGRVDLSAVSARVRCEVVLPCALQPLAVLVGGQALLRVGVHHQGLSKVWQM